MQTCFGYFQFISLRIVPTCFSYFQYISLNIVPNCFSYFQYISLRIQSHSTKTAVIAVHNDSVPFNRLWRGVSSSAA